MNSAISTSSFVSLSRALLVAVPSEQTGFVQGFNPCCQTLLRHNTLLGKVEGHLTLFLFDKLSILSGLLVWELLSRGVGDIPQMLSVCWVS
jgi:hypothetical protein